MRIFISHSSNGDDHAGQVRAGLSDRLKSNYEVLVDMEALRTGEDWCARLYEWLAVCDAAVILINQRALTSFWVRREINVLLWRRSLNHSFRVVPVLLGDVTRDDLEHHGLEELLSVQMQTIQPGSGTEPATLADRVANRFHPPPGAVDDQMGRWLRGVAGFLAQGERNRLTELTEAARLLGVAAGDVPDDWTWEGSYQFLAAQLLDEGLRDGRLERVVATLAGAFTRRDALAGLVKAVIPSWVDVAPARRFLPDPAADEKQPVVLVLNAGWQETAEHFLHRATCNALYGYRGIRAACDGMGAEGAEELAAHFDGLLLDALCLDDWELDDEQSRDLNTVYYLLVKVGDRPLANVAQAVGLLHDRHPWLIVVLLTGPSGREPDELRDAGLPNPTLVEPALGAGDEAAAKRLVRALSELPDRMFRLSTGATP